MKMPAEWDRFKFEVDPRKSRELTTVPHVAHVASACRIIEDRAIKAGLVYDESKLNRSRLNVAWVSANEWLYGSIYGTVEFQFTWADLVAGQKIYWVEVIEKYRPPAYRLLLSSRDFRPGLVTPYDPAEDEGPLRFNDGKYYWNDQYSSEFMVADDLSLDRCTGLNFVRHHEQYCRPFGSACEDRQSQPSIERTGGRVLAFILGRGLHVLDEHLKPAEDKRPFTNLDWAYEGLEKALQSQVQFGGPIKRADWRQAIVRGSLALYGMDQVDQAHELLALLPSEDTFTGALNTIIRAHFNDPNWEPWREEPAF